MLTYADVCRETYRKTDPMEARDAGRDDLESELDEPEQVPPASPHTLQSIHYRAYTTEHTLQSIHYRAYATEHKLQSIHYRAYTTEQVPPASPHALLVP